MSLSEGVRTRTQKIATLHSEELLVRFSAHSIVHYSEIDIYADCFYSYVFRFLSEYVPFWGSEDLDTENATLRSEEMTVRFSVLLDSVQFVNRN